MENNKIRMGLPAALFVLFVMILFSRTDKAYGAEKKLSTITAVYTGDTVLVGQSVDLNKLTVMGLYSDGSYVKIKDYSLSSYTVKEVGTNRITVSCDGVTGEFTVQGRQILLLSAYYKHATVTVGEELKREDITVRVYYSDGTNKAVEDYAISGTVVTKVGENEFFIVYEGETAKLSVTGKAIKLVQSLYAYYMGPAVIVGNAPKRDDFYVSVLYNDNSVERITAFELSPSVVQKQGDNMMVVSYGELTKEVLVQGLSKDVVSIEAEYTGLPVIVGKPMATEDIKVTATFNDGTKDEVSNYTLSSSVIYQIGDNLITVFCDGAIAYMTVRGVEAEIIDYNHAAEGFVRNGDWYSRIKLAVSNKVDPEGIQIEAIDADLVRKAMHRHVKSDKYIAFEVSFDDPNMDVFLPMTMKVTVPKEFDKEQFGVFYTPNRKTIMAQMNGEFIKGDAYEFKIFQPGTYIIADCTELIYVESVELEEAEITLKVGRSYSLDPVIYPHTATDKTVSYKSSRSQIVTVSQYGLLEAVSPGAAVITVEAKDGSGKKCKVLVYVVEKKTKK